MLEIVREYALERLAASGDEDDVRRRHATHFLELAERLEAERGLKEEAEWLAVLEDDHDNFRAAIRFALDTEDGELALRIAVSLGRFWELHGHLAEARTTFDAALAAGAGAPLLLRVLALNGAGIVSGEQGDLAAAAGYFERALVDGRELGAPDRIAAALTNLGNIALFAEDYGRARLLYEQSVELRRSAGVETGLDVAIENLGHVALAQGDVAGAIGYYEDASATSRAMGALHTVASASRSLGRALIVERRTDEALPHLDESLRLAHELGEPHGLAESLEAFAGAAAVSADWRRAALLVGAADSIRASIGAQRAPDQRRWYEDLLVSALDGVDEATFAAACDEGRRLSAEDAVALTIKG
jgi:tetratricopeptide (TPR) repeat protein